MHQLQQMVLMTYHSKSLSPSGLFVFTMKFKGIIRNKTLEIFNQHLIKPILIAMENKEVEIEIKPYRKSRTAAQNRWYWGVAIQRTVIPQLKNLTGEDFSKEEIHRLHLEEILKCKFTTRTILGKTVVIFEDKSTKDMSTVEFNTFKDGIQKYWASKGIDIPDPNEENFINQIENANRH